jgi:hypothetical protein
MPNKVGRGTYGGYQQPPAGNHPESEQHVLRMVYGKCRQQNPGEDPENKAKCARIAWSAVNRMK